MSLSLKVSPTGHVKNLPMFGNGDTFARRIRWALPDKSLVISHNELGENSGSLFVQALENRSGSNIIERQDLIRLKNAGFEVEVVDSKEIHGVRAQPKTPPSAYEGDIF